MQTNGAINGGFQAITSGLRERCDDDRRPLPEDGGVLGNGRPENGVTWHQNANEFYSAHYLESVA